MARKYFVLSLFLVGIFPTLLLAQQKTAEPFKMPLPSQRAYTEAPTDNGLWPKVYGGMQWTGGEDVDECYDKGYLITGCLVDYNSYKKMPILIKTDVNGNVLWEKRYRVPISYYYNYTYAMNSVMTSDGGMISIGATTSVDQCYNQECYDVFIMKLNACGEKEWCKVFSSPMMSDFGFDIQELPDGSFMAMSNSYADPLNEKRVWLMKLSPSGDFIWQKAYCDQITAFGNEIAYRLIKTSDNNILVSGQALFLNPSAPQWWYWSPFHLKTDFDGNDLWAESWSYDKADYSGEATQATEDKFGNYYTASNLGLPPQPCQCSPGALVQTGKNGNSMRYVTYTRHLLPIYGFGKVTGVIVLDTNSIFVAHGWANNPDTVNINAYISDTLGNILKEKHLIIQENGIPRSIQTTEKKFLMTAAHYFPGTAWDTYLYKLTQDLEYDSIDPRVITYDSLCPYAITSDTVALNCSIIVGLDEVFTNPEKNSLQIFPNPATEEINIILPESYTSEYQRGSLSVKTAHYQRPDNLELSITNSYGQRVYSAPLQKDATSVVVNLRSYRSGLYMVKIASPTQILWTGKFLKE